jgi:hypothetical protein
MEPEQTPKSVGDSRDVHKRRIRAIHIRRDSIKLAAAICKNPRIDEEMNLYHSNNLDPRSEPPILTRQDLHIDVKYQQKLMAHMEEDNEVEPQNAPWFVRSFVSPETWKRTINPNQYNENLYIGRSCNRSEPSRQLSHHAPPSSSTEVPEGIPQGAQLPVKYDFDPRIMNAFDYIDDQMIPVAREPTIADVRRHVRRQQKPKHRERFQFEYPGEGCLYCQGGQKPCGRPVCVGDLYNRDCSECLKSFVDQPVQPCGDEINCDACREGLPICSEEGCEIFTHDQWALAITLGGLAYPQPASRFPVPQNDLRLVSQSTSTNRKGNSSSKPNLSVGKRLEAVQKKIKEQKIAVGFKMEVTPGGRQYSIAPSTPPSKTVCPSRHSPTLRSQEYRKNYRDPYPYDESGSDGTDE